MILCSIDLISAVDLLSAKLPFFFFLPLVKLTFFFIFSSVGLNIVVSTICESLPMPTYTADERGGGSKELNPSLFSFKGNRALSIFEKQLLSLESILSTSMELSS
jgi:hypothetical protein